MDRYHHGDLPNTLVALVREHIRTDGPPSLRAIAREAGVDPAAVYRHFDSRDGLLRAVASRELAALAERMEAALTGLVDPRARLKAVGTTYVRFAVAEPGLFQLVFGPKGTQAGAEGRSGSGLTPWELLLREVRLVVESDEESVVKPPALACWAAVHGLAHLALADRLADPERQTSWTLDVLLAGLLAGHPAGVTGPREVP